VEAIVGPLPDEAHSYVAWWGTTPSGRDNNAHACEWWHTGYVADRPDFAARIVIFHRIGGP